MSELYIRYEYWIAASQLILAMIGMGATLTKDDFLTVIFAPKAITVGMISQMLAVPIVAFCFLKMIGADSGVAAGIALIAAIPGGTVSNIFTFFAKGNTALSISITALSTLLCLVTTPIILTWLIGQYLPADFAMPKSQIAWEISVNLLLPLLIGMTYLRAFPLSAPAVSKWCIRASLVGIGLIVVGSASAGRLNIAAFGLNNTLIILGFALILTLPGYFLPKLFSLSKSDSTAILFEVNLRNINLGVLLKVSIFSSSMLVGNDIGNGVILTLILFGFLQLFFSGMLIPLFRPKT